MDNIGTLDIPFKIIIAMIMIGSVIPLGFMSYRNVSREKFEMKIEEELIDLFNCAEKMSMNGNLSKQEIEIDLKGNIFADIEYVKIGDSLDGESNIIKYKLEWKKSPSYLSNDQIQLCSDQNDSLLLKDGKHSLVLTHIVYPGKSYILVSIK